MQVSCAIHDFQPVNKMRAVYRCTSCGGFAYKGERNRLGVLGELKMYKCHHPGCADRVVVIYPVVRAQRRHKPSCQQHRPDALP